MTILEVCHVIASINQNTGGSASYVTRLAEALIQEDLATHILTLDYKKNGEKLSAPGVEIHAYPVSLIANYLRGFQPQAKRKLDQISKDYIDIIHNHGLWMIPNLYARQASVRNRKPLIISPHGMLESWSLKHAPLKKSIAWLLYEQDNLRSASLFHATSVEEAHSIRQLGFLQPIAIIPNGVDLPCLLQPLNQSILTDIFPELIQKKWLLFLSRLHPKKGIENLLYAWKALHEKFQNWHLVLAGPDLTGYQTKLEALAQELGLQSSVTFTGMLSGTAKAVAQRYADLFVLPTYSENFGIAIAESLSYAVPVITTKGTPWQDLKNYQCGWWIDNNCEALISALQEGMQLSEQERKEMGLRGRDLVAAKYNWSFVTQQMASVYRWLLEDGAAPKCIQFD